MTIELGHHVRCRLTDFAGTATGRAVYLYEVPSIQVTRADSCGKPESVWLPEGQLEQTTTTTDPPSAGFGAP